MEAVISELKNHIDRVNSWGPRPDGSKITLRPYHVWSKDYSGDNCPICDDRFSINGKDGPSNADAYHYPVQCGHYVCVDCIKEMIRNKLDRCPVCRGDWWSFLVDQRHYYDIDDSDDELNESSDDEKEEPPVNELVFASEHIQNFFHLDAEGNSEEPIHEALDEFIAYYETKINDHETLIDMFRGFVAVFGHPWIINPLTVRQKNKIRTQLHKCLRKVLPIFYNYNFTEEEMRRKIERPLLSLNIFLYL
jgi:hypothetical protein